MIRVFLFLNAIFFLGFGAFAFLNAPILAGNLGAPDMGSNGLYELRSNYGGVSIGAGLLCLCGGISASLQRPALFFLLAYTGGYALGRVMAIPLDGVPPPRLIGFSIFEAVTAILAFMALRHRSS
ncbi:MAG: DUF4345 family protein [Pseudomonadota bacterium]